MLPRAKSFPALSLLLAAVLAWPANLPLFARPDPPRVATASPTSRPRVDLSVGRVAPDTKARWADSAAVGADLEEADGWDLPRCLPLALRVGPADLPSLVPSPCEGRRPDVADAPGRARRSPPLRC